MGQDPAGFDQYQILASRVTPEGTFLDPDGIVAASDIVEASGVHRMDMTAGNGRSVVVWSMDYGGEGGPAAENVRAVQIAAYGTVSVHPANAVT